MGIFKSLKIKNAFKKGKLVHTSEMPLKIERDTLLVSQSIDKDVPIVIGKQSRVDELKFFNKDVQILRIAPTYTIEFRDVELPNGVFIDESVANDCVKWLMINNIKISGGFSEN